MNQILVLNRYTPSTQSFQVEKVECSDEDFKHFTAVCDSFYYKIEITESYSDLRFGHYSSSTRTQEVTIPHKNILIRDGQVTGFLYDLSQTPDGYGGYNGQMVFLLEDEGKKKDVGGRASVGCHSTFESCTLVKRSSLEPGDGSTGC